MWRTTEKGKYVIHRKVISIHVLRVEDDVSIGKSTAFSNRFQSTSSVWRTTFPVLAWFPARLISIHVLRVEDDFATLTISPDKWDNFNPRPPCGGRPPPPRWRRGPRIFQSTSSVWRTTQCIVHVVLPIKISIHVLRVEDDLMPRPAGRGTFDFNPRPPCGGRQQKQRKISICIHIIQQFVQICNRNIAPMLSFAQIGTNNPPKNWCEASGYAVLASRSHVLCRRVRRSENQHVILMEGGANSDVFNLVLVMVA